MKKWQSVSVIAAAMSVALFTLCSPLTLRAQPRITEAQAAALRPTPPSLVDRSGTFWSVSRPQYPPEPTDPYPNLPAYRLPDSTWLVDDSTVIFPPPAPADAPASARNFLTQTSLASQQRLASPMLSDDSVPGLPDPTNSPPPVDPIPPVLLAPGTAPTNATFWMLAETNWPPFFYNPCPTNCDVYVLSDGSYLVNDASYSWPAPSGDGGGGQGPYQPEYADGDFRLEITGVTNSRANLILHGTTSNTLYTIMSRESASSTDPWDAEQPLIGAAGQNWTPTQIPTFGRRVLFFRALVGSATPQRLRLYALGIANNCFNVVLWGTLEGTHYDLQSITALHATNNWATETNFLGASGQFWTQVSIPLSGRPSLFLSARSWIDSNGSGIPDWWLLLYFGRTDIDPYALCPSGDGWTILQAYQNGWDPNLFYTPPPPRDVAARLDSTRANVTITWESGGGPVTNYVIQSAWIDRGFGPAVATVGQTNASTFALAYSPGSWFLTPTAPAMNYFVTAYFANGTHSDSAQAPLWKANLSPTMAVVRGPTADLRLIVPSLPHNVSRIRLFWFSPAYDYLWIDVDATNVVSGSMRIPLDQMAGYVPGAEIDVQALATDVDFGAISYLFPSIAAEELTGGTALPPTRFVDARRHLKENLKFLLQSATLSQPFAYVVGDSDSPDPELCFFPETEFARPPSPTNYEYSGFHVFSANLNYSVLQEYRPAQENYLWRNLAYDSADFDGSGSWTTLDGQPSGSLRWLDGAKYQFTGTNDDPLPLALSLTNHAYLLALWVPLAITLDGFAEYVAEMGIVLNETNHVYVPTGVRNIYGLPLNSVLIPQVQFPTGVTLAAGGPPSFVWSYLRSWYYFCAFQTPALQTTNYYFASQTRYLSSDYSGWSGSGPLAGLAPPLPGSPTFSVTNTSPLLITGFGQPITVAGWAKQAIENGYSGKYGYLEQYFDKAYTIGPDGADTTNEAGILSPYGEFFPMQPGPAALVTLPDIDPPYQRGTGVVNVIKLQLDVNHDGIMDLSFAGPDNTSQARPYVHWVNNDFDRLTLDSDGVNWYDDDVLTADCPLTPNHATTDCNYRDGAGNRVIPCARDLQDFTRLWVCGVTSNLLAALPPGSTVTLSWGDVGNPNPANPTIDLFQAADPDGGISYLTNSAISFAQIDSLYCPYIRRLGPGQSIQLNSSQFPNGWAGNYFIWCGVSNGTGGLTMTIADGNSNTLAQTTAYIQIVDIKQMYERWTIGEKPSVAPLTNALPAEEGVAQPFQYGPPTDANTPYILYVHGWNMQTWEKDRFAEAAFKRLYWQGYQGRFGVFRWPTDNGFTGNWWQALTDTRNYDNSECIAWQSAARLVNKLTDLNAQYPGHVYMLAHSMGNVVAGEALRLAGNNQVINIYVASQGAIPAHMYDSTVTNALQFTYTYPVAPLSYLGSRNYGPDTPNIYGDWLTNNSAAVGRRINFYNGNDYALAMPRWGFDQITKPDYMPPNHYYYYAGSVNDSSPWNHFMDSPIVGGAGTLVDITTYPNRYRIMSYAAESRSTALGATPGIITFDDRLALTTVWPTDASGHNYADHFWHSAQFRGDCWHEWNYWNTLLRSGSKGFNISN